MTAVLTTLKLFTTLPPQRLFLKTARKTVSALEYFAAQHIWALMELEQELSDCLLRGPSSDKVSFTLILDLPLVQFRTREI